MSSTNSVPPDDHQGPLPPPPVIPVVARRQATGDTYEAPDSLTGSIIIDIENETDPSRSLNASLLLAPNEPRPAAGHRNGPENSPGGNLSTLANAGVEHGNTRAHPSTIASHSDSVMGNSPSQYQASSTRPSPIFNPDIEPFINPDIGDADVWKNYIKEAAESDKLSIEGWNQDMDVILIFAGLFSAVLTAFIIEFYRFLKPEQDDISAQLLVDISLVLRASAQGLPIPEPLANLTALEYDFEAPNYIVWVNSLWFSSLICSLGVAIAVMVVKQWFQFYTTNLNSGDAHTDSLHRQFRHNALLRWRVPTIVSAIPLFMHLSVGLFFAGLVVLLWNTNIDVAYVVLALVVFVYSCYFFTMLLPFFSTSCPYKSSALTLLQDLSEWTVVVFWSGMYWICHAFELSSKDITKAKAWLVLRREKLGIEFVGRTSQWLRSLNKGANNFYTSPPRFTKRHLDEAERGRDKDWEELIIEKTQTKLDIDSVLWLVRSSGKQNLVDLGLACISQLKPEPKLIQYCLRNNVQTLLRDRSYIPLPYPDHDFWKKLKMASPSDCLTRREEARIPSIQAFLHSLMFVWHHPAYYEDDDPPPALSNSLVWDRPSFFADSQWKLRLPEAAAEESTQPPPRLLGDWLILWRAMKIQNADYHTIAYRLWNLNFFATIVCIETHFFHLTRGAYYVDGPLKLGDMHDIEPWSDLYNLINDYGLGALQLNDRTVEQILDTFIYVVSSTRKPETHVLLKTEVLLALLQLLKSRQMMYDNVLQKLLLSLQMFTLDGWKRRQLGKVYYQNCGMGRIDRNTVYQRFSTVLYTLITTYSRPPATNPSGSVSSNMSLDIVDISSVLLYMTHLELDEPLRTYDDLFTTLPIDPASQVIQYISTSALHEWRTPETLLWVVELLCKWLTRPGSNLEQEERESIIKVLGEILCYSWADITLTHLSDKILPVFKQMLESSDIPIAQKVSEESCHSLRSTFLRPNEEHKSTALLMEYIHHRMFTAVAAFLASDRASQQSKQDWAKFRRSWRQERRRDSQPERHEYEQLHAQTHSDTPDATPLLADGGAGPLPGGERGGEQPEERAATPWRQPVFWRSSPLQVADDITTHSTSSARNSTSQAGTPNTSPRNTLFPHQIQQ